uniref:Fanconi-associated nuclease n=1 Tax=Globodera rostochiensis TaxID=31243 RepID=A0A914HIY4_GLORO
MTNSKRSDSGRKRNRATNKKDANSSHSICGEQTIGTLENAFRTALRGRMCTICKKRVAHAIYQRHSNDCSKTTADNYGSDEDIIFCGIVPSSSRNEEPIQRQLKTERRSSQAGVSFTDQTNESREGIETASADTATTSNPSHNDNANDDNRDVVGSVGAIPILEVYQLCHHYLDKFIGQQSLANSQTQRSSQRIDKENFLRKESDGGTELNNKSGETNQSLTDNETSNGPHLFSQQMHQKIEQSSSEDARSARYSLRIVWSILQKVLLCPEPWGSPESATIYWGEYLRTLLKFLSLPVETQQLLVLLLRRRWGWHLIRDIQAKYSDIVRGDYASHFEKLCRSGLMQTGSSPNAISLKEALKLLKKAEFLLLCKKFKINGTGQNISTLTVRFLKLGEQRTILGGKRAQIILKNIRTLTGEFFRVDGDVLHLFTTFFTVYSPTYMDTARLFEFKFNEELSGHLIFTVLQFESGSLGFPSPADCPHTLVGVIGSIEELMSYTKAKHTEERIIRLLNRQPPAFEEALECAKAAKETLSEEFLLSEGGRTRCTFFCGLPAYHRRFTAPWVLCRCIFAGGAEVAQKLRNYELAVELLKLLLETDVIRHFCMNSRGKWYERIALNLERHLKDLEQSVHFCQMGMRDELVGKADKLILQQRLIKLLNRMKQIPVQADALFITLETPERMEINGTTLAKGLGDGEQVNHFYIPTNNREEFNKCSVEELVLHHFLTAEQFTHGIHSEGTIWHTLFRLFFTDIIFDADVPKVWLSRIQDDPLDLNFSNFYRNRKAAIDQRLKEIRSTDNLSALSLRFYDKVKSKVALNSRILWHNSQNADQIASFLNCCAPLMLHDLFMELCTDFREARSGFPDLIVWNEGRATMAVVEVKGPNDTLSAKQQLWLHFFRTRGVRAVVCHVVARSDRML